MTDTAAPLNVATTAASVDEIREAALSALDDRLAAAGRRRNYRAMCLALHGAEVVLTRVERRLRRLEEFRG